MSRRRYYVDMLSRSTAAVSPAYLAVGQTLPETVSGCTLI